MAQVEFSDLPVANTPENINKVVTALEELKAGINAIHKEQLAEVIPYSLLNLLGSIVDADVSSSAAIDHTKLDLDGMDLDNIAPEVVKKGTLTSGDIESTSAYQNVCSTPAVSGAGLYLIIAQMTHKQTGYSAGSSLLRSRLVNLITAQTAVQDDVYWTTPPGYFTQRHIDLFSMSDGHTATLQFQDTIHGVSVYTGHYALNNSCWIKAIKLFGT